MKFPICKVCLKNELLCNACAEMVGQNEIKVDEIKMYRRLNKILMKEKSLKDIEIKRAVGKNTLIIIAKSEDVSKLIGKEGSTVKKLAKQLNRPIRVMAQPSNIKDFVDDILFTVPIMGINILYKPEGKTYLIRIPRSNRTRLPISSDILASVSRSLFDENVDVIFE
jgi:transcription antitermination factor NusA-like protein